MADITTETKLTAAYTELYSPEMKALCDLAISIIGQVHIKGLVERVGGHTISSKDAVMEAVLEGPQLSSDEFEALERLFGDLQTHIVYSRAFQDGIESERA